MSKQWLKVSEAADEIGVHRNTIYAAIRNGRLQHVRIGRAIRIRRDALDTFLRDGQVDVEETATFHLQSL